MAELFRSAYNINTLVTSATINVTAGQITRLGEYKVQAGELITLGYGEQTGQDNSVGRIYALIKDTTGTPVILNGMLRLSIFSPQNRPLKILGEWRTETLSSGASDRSLQTPFPEYSDWLSEDKKLVLEFISDTTAVFSKANSTLLMDMTVEAL